MKKIITSVVGFFYVSLFFSQSISNSGFEGWSLKNLYNEPSGFLTSNLWSVSASGIGNVKKVAGAYGMFAAELKTVLAGNDTIPGMVLIGTPGNQTIDGGYPYSGIPDSVSFYVKYNIQPNDTGFFILLFKKSSTITGQIIATFSGVQNTFKRIVLPTNLVNPPDSLAAVITCSKMDQPQIVGSTLTIDSINMINSGKQFPNGNFETWNAINSDEPDNWKTSNYFSSGYSSVTKSTDSYSGNYSIKVESVVTPWGDTAGFFTNGFWDSDNPEGGMDVNANPQKITGYYKYFPQGNDTALAGIWLYRSDTLIDSMIVKLPPSTTYTYFEIPLAYNSLPLADILNISFSSSNMNGKGVGSVLYVDNLDIVYYPIPVNISEITNETIKVYPNPTTERLSLTLSKGEGTLEIYNVFGEKIFFLPIGKSMNVDLSIQIPGIYFCKITNSERKIQTVKIIVAD